MNMVIEENIMVPMRDGVKLATDVYRPAQCFSIKSLPPLGLNPNACGDVAKHLSLIRCSQNDRAGALVRSLEHVHRLVGLYPLNKYILFSELAWNSSEFWKAFW